MTASTTAASTAAPFGAPFGASFAAAFAALTLAAGLVAPGVAEAQPQARIETVQRCLGDSTTGRERKELARWIFLGMAAHPEIRDLAVASQDASERSSRFVGQLVTRLIVENCATEIRAMVREAGPRSMELAFQFLGQLAMKELMTDAAVNSSLTVFERYVDRARVNAVVEGK